MEKIKNLIKKYYNVIIGLIVIYIIFSLIKSFFISLFILVMSGIISYFGYKFYLKNKNN